MLHEGVTMSVLFTTMFPRLRRASGNSRCLTNICLMNDWLNEWMNEQTNELMTTQMNKAQLDLCSSPGVGFHIHACVTKTDWSPLGKYVGTKGIAAAFHSPNPVQGVRGTRAVPSSTHLSRDQCKGLPNTFPQEYHRGACWFNVPKRYSGECYQCVNSPKT